MQRTRADKATKERRAKTVRFARVTRRKARTPHGSDVKAVIRRSDSESSLAMLNGRHQKE